MRVAIGSRIPLLALPALLALTASVACSGEDDAGEADGSAGTSGVSEGGTSQDDAGEADSGAGTSGTSGVGGTSGMGGGDGVVRCAEPTPVIDPSTGWVRCEGNFFHRASVGSCAPHTERGAPVESFMACQDDSECPKGNLCWTPAQNQFARCTYDCETDADCGEGEICFCDAIVNQCVTSNCATDADCGTALLCASYRTRCSQAISGVACQTEQDSCTTGDGCDNYGCVFDDDRRSCMGTGGC